MSTFINVSFKLEWQGKEIKVGLYMQNATFEITTKYF